jgi:hypothetical protein
MGLKSCIPKVITGLLILQHECIKVVESNTFAFQSGFQFHESSGAVDGDSYGSSIDYDRENKLLYVTGSTYWSFWDRSGQTIEDASKANYLEKSDCFLGVIHVSPSTHKMETVFADRFGKSDIPEACSAVSFMKGSSRTKSELFTVGHTDERGFLTSLRPFGSPKSTMYGFMLNLKFDVTLDKNNHVSKVRKTSDGGKLYNDEITQYPVAVTKSPDASKKEIFVVSLTSTFDNQNSHVRPYAKPDLSASGGMDEPEYGKNFNVMVEKIVPMSDSEIEYEEAEIDSYPGFSKKEDDGVEIKFKSEWSKMFSVNNPDFVSTTRMLNEDTGEQLRTFSPYVRVSDIKYIQSSAANGNNDALIIAGTTNGYGVGFGMETSDDNQLPFNHGFVTKLSTNGDVLKSIPIHVSGKWVSIKGICYDKHNDHENFNYENLYVVGETNGRLDKNMNTQDVTSDSSGITSKHAFLTKISVTTLEVLWTRQIGSVNGNDVFGYSCAVSKVDDIVYMAGTVENGDSLNILHRDRNDSDDRVRIEPSGGNDVFVVNFQSSGKMNFARQFGTSEHDSIAKGNSIVIGEGGDAIILGNTKGSMFRWRGQGALSDDGFPYDVFITSISKDTGDTRVISEESRTSVNEDDTYFDDILDDHDLFGFEIVAIAMSSTIFFITLLYMGYNILKTGINDRNEKIVSFLNDFKDDEVNIRVRESATGGIHGIYSPHKNDSAWSKVYHQKKESREKKFENEKRVLFTDYANSPSSGNQNQMLSALEGVEEGYIRNRYPSVTETRISQTNSKHESLTNAGLSSRKRPPTPAPPTLAFSHENDSNTNIDDDDDEWDNEFL